MLSQFQNTFTYTSKFFMRPRNVRRVILSDATLRRNRRGRSNLLNGTALLLMLASFICPASDFDTISFLSFVGSSPVSDHTRRKRVPWRCTCTLPRRKTPHAVFTRRRVPNRTRHSAVGRPSLLPHNVHHALTTKKISSCFHTAGSETRERPKPS